MAALAISSFHKPFWHDYWASTDNFHMSRWGDGDSFLVNYIGHPMEGAVAGDIFLNNDPKGRSARFGKSSTYWYSRLKAMAWATVFEAYFEVGPVLSEAAIGNEGGYTYVPGCGLYPCDKYPGKHFKPPTNNTGWVDFVITPTVGMGWIVLEDAIEREFVDRIAKDSPALKYKILRGSLAPSHTFANMFAGKKPWFRYPAGRYLHADLRWPSSSGRAPSVERRASPQLRCPVHLHELPLDRESCANCKQFVPGYGFDFTYRLAKYAYFDSVANLFPGSGSYGQHGGAQEGLVGLKLGRTLDNGASSSISATASFTTTRPLFQEVPLPTKAPGATPSTSAAPSNTTLRAIPSSASMPVPPSFTTSRATLTPIRPHECSLHAVLFLPRQPLSHHRLRLPLLIGSKKTRCEGFGTRLYDSCGLKVLHAASGIYVGCLDFDLRNLCREIRRKREGGVLLVKSALYGHCLLPY